MSTVRVLLFWALLGLPLLWDAELGMQHTVTIISLLWVLWGEWVGLVRSADVHDAASRSLFTYSGFHVSEET
ncbi:MAG: hypothetical protein HY268_34645 [Deltaproteobacteria bacterium]|nr:hypothetical protein [Deltaproteobacteria bacterium]